MRQPDFLAAIEEVLAQTADESGGVPVAGPPR
jgi:hypothetical protein